MWPFTNGIFNTLVTNLRRQQLPSPGYERIGIPTPDGDELALDMASLKSSKAILMIHGLEGDSQSSYVKGMVRAIHELGLDALCLNLRGCGGGLPRKPKTYHSGKSEDVSTVVQYLQERMNYEQIGVIGFSLGGNLALKYAGEQESRLPAFIKFISGIAVPYDLKAVVRELDKPRNVLFRHHFLRTLKIRARKMVHQFPKMPVRNHLVQKVSTLEGFDEAFTAPVNGFLSAIDYYRESSCIDYLAQIDRPTLLVAAQDDPFIPFSCTPVSEIKGNEHLRLVESSNGGHLGFGHFRMPFLLWHERLAMAFIKQHLC